MDASLDRGLSAQFLEAPSVKTVDIERYCYTGLLGVLLRSPEFISRTIAGYPYPTPTLPYEGLFLCFSPKSKTNFTAGSNTLCARNGRILNL
jgi:hypothetical protein